MLSWMMNKMIMKSESDVVDVEVGFIVLRMKL